MAKRQGDGSPGPMAVGLLALHDRDFFARLLKDPRRAMNEKVAEGKLRLTTADIDRVVEVIQERSKRGLRKDPLEMWDRYKESGFWDNGDWPMGWVP